MRVTVLQVLLAILSSPALSQSGFKVGPATIEARDGSKIEVEYGTVQVPENRSQPGSRLITLATMHVKSPLKKKGTPVFPLAGGPGGDSIGMVTNSLVGGGQQYLRWMGGDIVAIDQRGTGQSEPKLLGTVEIATPLDEPGDAAKTLARLQRAYRNEAERWRAKGVDLRGYTTIESADDIDLVRETLGFEKISLWGGSYGSHLALATIRRHGEHIDRAVLIGPEGPDHTIKLPSYAQVGLERIAKRVAAHPKLRQEIPDFMGLVESVLSRLHQQPAFVEVQGKRVAISKYDLQGMLAGAIGVSPAEIAEIPADLLALDRGDYTKVAEALFEERRGPVRYSAMQMIMDSASGITKQRLAQIEQEKETCLLGDSVNGPFPHLAEAWGAPDLGDEFRGPLQSDCPVLFIVGDLDSRTPIRNAKELMPDLPNSHLIVVENAAHAVRWNQADLAEAWSGFLAGETPAVTKLVAEPIRFSLPEGIEPDVPEGTAELTAKELAACVGRYKFSNGMVFSIRAASNRLVGTIPGRGKFNLWAKSPTTFVADNPNIPPLTFVLDSAGKAARVEGDGRVGQRVE
ncbi:MAG: alpha/beta hydrolase [Planctomycetota bacterium]